MKIFAALSGGVDSAVAALLLRREGHDVVGIHLRTGVPAEGTAPGARPRCCGSDEAADARRVCDLLGIPFFVQNAEAQFRGLIASFAESYARGETPNPCVACNQGVKFGALLDRARGLGADAIATGHYARRLLRDGRHVIARARDATKDQSYVLYGLGQESLSRAIYPLGDLTKGEVRRIAREERLPVADKPESQEICFVPSGDYRDLVRKSHAHAFEPGDLVDEVGRVLGHHEGIGSFTVGQRKGIGIAGPEPLYVLGIDAGEARITVGPKASLRREEAHLDEVVWNAIEAPSRPVEVDAVLRYRARPTRALVESEGSGGARLAFEEPAWPVTPGQAAVLYDGDVVLGGGRIRWSS